MSDRGVDSRFAGRLRDSSVHVEPLEVKVCVGECGWAVVDVVWCETIERSAQVWTAG